MNCRQSSIVRKAFERIKKTAVVNTFSMNKLFVRENSGKLNPILKCSEIFRNLGKISENIRILF